LSNPVTERRYVFATATAAAGVTAKRVRNWLDADQVSLDAGEDRAPGKWRRFSVWDAVRLALVGRLVAYACPVVEANRIVAEYLERHVLLRRYRNMPPPALAAALRGQLLFAWLDPKTGRWHSAVNTPAQPLDSSVPDTAVLVDAERVVRSVLERLESTSS